MIYNKSLLLILFILLQTFISEAQEKSWMFGPFERSVQENPVITPNDNSTFYCPMQKTMVKWESMATFNPAAIVKNSKIFVLYRAEDKLGEMMIGGHTSRLGMAISTDGITYKTNDEPVLYPKEDQQKKYEWPGGCEDPRIVETEDGDYVLTYTQWNREIPRLAIATSKDLINWQKYGPAFAKAYDGKYLNLESKSGAILVKQQGNKMIPAKIDGKYWMYFGVPKIYLATSDDLISWKPLEDENNNMVPVLSPRPGYFDSWLVEAGPPAMVTDDGILVIYNAGNSKKTGVSDLGNKTYTGGQALFDAKNPIKLVDRSDHPFIKPEMDYEKTGQYQDGTTFVEGLVNFKGKWYLYYGTADSKVAVAVWDPGKQAYLSE